MDLFNCLTVSYARVALFCWYGEDEFSSMVNLRPVGLLWNSYVICLYGTTRPVSVVISLSTSCRFVSKVGIFGQQSPPVFPQ